MQAKTSIARLSRFVLLVLVVGTLTWAGCDSNEDDGDGNGDADRLIGTWDATSVKAGSIDVLSLTDLSLSLTLENNGDGQIVATEDNGDVTTITGTYTVDVDNGTITLDGDGVEENLVMDYTLVDDNTLSVEFPGSDLANIGIDLGAIGDLITNLTIHVDLERAAS